MSKGVSRNPKDTRESVTKMTRRLLPVFPVFTNLIICLLSITTGAYAESGAQTINGTRVFTVVDRSRGVATFSNECGSQTLTQRQLQAGAIPNEIVPCPRPRKSIPNTFDPVARAREILSTPNTLTRNWKAEAEEKWREAYDKWAKKLYSEAALDFMSAESLL